MKIAIRMVLVAVLGAAAASLSGLECLPAAGFTVKPGEAGDEVYLYLETEHGMAIPFFLMVPGQQASPTGAVIFLPQYGGTAFMWKTQARKATAGGVFSISVQVEATVPGKASIGWNQVDAAVAQIVQWLATQAAVRPDRIGLVGSSLGGNHAMVIFQKTPQLFGLFALSPGLDYYGYRPGEALAHTDGRQAVVVAAQDDAESYDALEAWRKKYPGAEYLGMSGGGHGYALVQRQPAVAERLQGFLMSLR